MTLLWRPDMVQLQALHAAVIVFTAFLRVRVFDIDSNFHLDFVFDSINFKSPKNSLYNLCAIYAAIVYIRGFDRDLPLGVSSFKSDHKTTLYSSNSQGSANVAVVFQNYPTNIS